MAARHRAWELATLFVTTAPYWEHDEAVHLVIKDAEARNGPSFYTTIDLRQTNWRTCFRLLTRCVGSQLCV